MSLFNPWVILGILIAIGSAFGGGYSKGRHDEFTKQQLQIASLNADARQKEQALVSAVNTQSNQLMKANQNAKLYSKSAIVILTVVLSSCGSLSKPQNAPYTPPQIPPLPAEVTQEVHQPNLTERLLKLLSPSQTKEMPPSENLQPVSPSTTKPSKP